MFDREVILNCTILYSWLFSALYFGLARKCYSAYILKMRCQESVLFSSAICIHEAEFPCTVRTCRVAECKACSWHAHLNKMVAVAYRWASLSSKDDKLSV